MPMHFKTELLQAVAKGTGQPRLYDSVRSLSLQQLRDEAAALVHVVRNIAPAPDKLALFVPNSCNYPVCFYAAQFLGVPCVPLNILLAPREVEAIVDDAQISLIIAADQFRPVIDAYPQDLRSRLRVLYISSEGKLCDMPVPAASQVAIESIVDEPAPGDADSLAAILYTSGTTGVPKGVMLTQRCLVSNAYGSIDALRMTPDDMCYMLLPLFHSFGLTMTNMMILAGGSIWFEQKFNPHAVIETIAAQRVTTLFLTPSFFRVLLRSEMLSADKINSLKLTLSGGAPLPLPLQVEWRERTGLKLLNGYGLTETSPVVSLNSPHRNRDVSIGPAIKNVEVEVRGSDGKPLPAGETGELCVRGPNVMKGYLNKPQETAAVLSEDGWFKTGDLAYIDEDGFIFLTGRQKELIIYGGQNVLPQEVEHALLEFEGVLEAAVVGIEDETKGEYPKAFVVMREGATATARQLHEFLRDRIASYKIPRQFEFIPALPKNTLGKVLKRELKTRK